MSSPAIRSARSALHTPLLVLMVGVALSSCTAASDGGTAPEVEVETEAVVTTVAITNGAQALSAIGSVFQLTVDVRDSNGNAVQAAAIQWTSSSPAVVSVSSTGLATAILNGSADVTATVSGVSGSVTITVAQVGETLLITVPSDTLTALGVGGTASARVVDANGNELADTVATWSSSDLAILRFIEAPELYAEANGTAVLTASIGSVSGSVTITVAQVGETLLITAPSDTLTALGVGGTASARVVDANGNELADTVATWSSSDLAILRFTEAPELYAEANGTAVLTASIGTFTGTADIVVAQRAASVVLTPPTDTLRTLTDSTQMAAVAVDANGFAVTSGSGVWTSMAPGVATVSGAGVVVAVADGVAEIVYAVVGVPGSAFITVNLDQMPASLTIALDLTSLFAQGALVATATLINADGFEVTGPTLDWTPSDPSVTVGSVGVDSLGRATARLITTATLGTFSIQAQDPGTGVLGSTGFTVTAAPAPQGVSIDFETDAAGNLLVTGDDIGSQFIPWGIRFGFVDVFAGGGNGRGTLLGGAGTRYLDNDRRSTFEFLTGSHEMTFSGIDIGTFDAEFYYPPAAVIPAVTAWDAFGREIPGIVVDKVALAFDWWAITVHSPILLRKIKIGPSNGRIRLDNIVY